MGSVKEPTTAGAIVPLPADSAYMTTIERLATNPECDPNKLEKILDMKYKEQDREAERAFNMAMVSAQTDMPTVKKDQENTQTHSRYSSYERILKMCKPIYTAAGFAVSFYETEGQRDGNIRFNADVMHAEGHTKKYWTDIPLDDKGAKGTVNKTQTHAKGSSLSYGRSYLLRMIFNIPTGDDDDGNAAGGADFISMDQQTEILDLLKETNANVDKFLEYMGVSAVDEISTKKYPVAITALKAKAGKK